MSSEKVFTQLTEIIQEIDKHDLKNFFALSSESEEVRLAVEYLYQAGKVIMAETLENMAESHRILVGPVQGFAASVYQKDKQEFIILSNQYEAYNISHELICSLVHEIHFLKNFLPMQEDTEVLEAGVFQWLNKRQEAIKNAFKKSA